MVKTLGVFHLQKNSQNFRWEFSLWKSVFHLSQVPLEGAGGGLATSKTAITARKPKESENGTQISTGKTGLPLQKFCLFWKISSGTNQTVVFYLHPNQNFRNFLVNGKRLLPLFGNCSFHRSSNKCLKI